MNLDHEKLKTVDPNSQMNELSGGTHRIKDSKQ